MQEVEAPFDEVVRPVVHEEVLEAEVVGAKDIQTDALTMAKKDEPIDNDDQDDDNVPDLMDTMVTSDSSSLEQSMITMPQKEEETATTNIYRAIVAAPMDAKRTRSLLMPEEEGEDDEQQQLPDSPTVSIISSNSSVHSVAESSIDTHRVRLPDFEDRFDPESAAFALVDTMCAPVDMVCNTKNNVVGEDEDSSDDDIRADDEDTYTFFPRKQKERTSKFPLANYAACGAAEDVAPKSIMSEAIDSWNLLLKKCGNQLTMQEVLERPTPSFQSSNGSNDS